MKRIIKLLFLPLLSAGLLTYVFMNSIQPKLGLDLQGGISVILTAEEDTEPEEEDDADEEGVLVCWPCARLLACQSVFSCWMTVQMKPRRLPPPELPTGPTRV